MAQSTPEDTTRMESTDGNRPTRRQSDTLRELPSVDRLLGSEALGTLAEDVGVESVTHAAREAIDAARGAILGGETDSAPDIETLTEHVTAAIGDLLGPRPRRVINAAGVIIHTNLGRAPLSQAAIAAMTEVARGYSNLEYDLGAGERGSRHAHPELLLRFLTGAEAAIVVNNNASAVLLALAAIAGGREVIVSRGEAVEIGGRFRIPDVLRQSGAILVEVGTTNRTYAADYADAITDNTGALLRVHRSNFVIIGFTNTPDAAEIADIAHAHDAPLINDLGSGCLLDTAQFGLAPEPTVRDALERERSDLALFSGDKLLGGPQAGIAVGRKDLIDKMKTHPLARAVRIDKLDLAALTATLQAYARGTALQEVPVWRMISADMAALDERALRWREEIGGDGLRVVEAETAVGGGSLPGGTLLTRALAIEPERFNADAISERLRTSASHTAVIGRIEDDRFLLDPRTVLPEEDDELIAAVRAALAGE